MLISLLFMLAAYVVDVEGTGPTEQAAIAEAMRNAAPTHLTATTQVADATLISDRIRTKSKAKVMVLSQSIRQDGPLYIAHLRAEVTDTPPLSVDLWADKQAYRPGEHFQVFFKGSAPFHGRLTCNGVQFLPSKYRPDSHFAEGEVITLPSQGDAFVFTMNYPGITTLTLYATSEDGETATATIHLQTFP